MAKTIRVRAGVGKLIPLIPAIRVDSDIAVLTPENVVTVLQNRFTRRRLRTGDFVEVKDTPPPAKETPKKVKE